MHFRRSDKAQFTEKKTSGSSVIYIGRCTSDGFQESLDRQGNQGCGLFFGKGLLRSISCKHSMASVVVSRSCPKRATVVPTQKDIVAPNRHFAVLVLFAKQTPGKEETSTVCFHQGLISIARPRPSRPLRVGSNRHLETVWDKSLQQPIHLTLCTTETRPTNISFDSEPGLPRWHILLNAICTIARLHELACRHSHNTLSYARQSGWASAFIIKSYIKFLGFNSDWYRAISYIIFRIVRSSVFLFKASASIFSLPGR